MCSRNRNTKTILLYFNKFLISRILLSNSKNNESFQSPLIDEMPNEDSSDCSCGWFLEWFHLIIAVHTRASLKQCLKEKFSSETDDEDYDEDNEKKKEREALIEKATLYAKAWRTRWHTFFRHLWNNPTIQALIDQQLPQSTKVKGAKNGFVFIIEVIAENIFHKVFYGCTHLPTIKIKTSTGIVRESFDVKVLTKKGFDFKILILLI